MGLFVGLMGVYALLTDPVFREVLCRRAGLLDPADVGKLETRTRPFSANDLSNYATIDVLAQRGRWEIATDRGGFQSFSVFPTGDMARIKGDYYSVRPPVLPFVLSGFYAAQRHVTGWQFRDRHGPRAGESVWNCIFLLSWITGGLATAVMSVQLGRSLALLGVSRGRCWAAALLLGLGSLALPYATVLNHHSVAGALIATAAFFLLRGQVEGRAVDGAVVRPVGSARDEFTKRQAIVAGFCAGLAATVDVAVGGMFLMAALVWVVAVPALRRRLPWGIAAVLVPGIVHGVLNYQITGDVVPALVRREYFDYPSTSIPLDGISGLPNNTTPGEILPYLAKLLWGPRGLLTYSAPLLFAALAAARIARVRAHPFRVGAILLLVWGCAYLLYLSIYTNNFSGACYGIRWFVPLLPAGYVLLFAGWGHLHRAERWAAAVALATSIPIAWTGAVFGAWQLDHLFPVLCWIPGLPEWTGDFGEWSADVPYLGWVMLLGTIAWVVARALRAVRSRTASV